MNAQEIEGQCKQDQVRNSKNKLMKKVMTALRNTDDECGERKKSSLKTTEEIFA